MGDLPLTVRIIISALITLFFGAFMSTLFDDSMHFLWVGIGAFGFSIISHGYFMWKNRNGRASCPPCDGGDNV